MVIDDSDATDFDIEDDVLDVELELGDLVIDDSDALVLVLKMMS